MTKKRILVITSITILVICSIYTAAWFFVKHTAENIITTQIQNLTKQPSIEHVSYSLKSGCFPALCIELKDVKVKTKKYFAVAKQGFEFYALQEFPLVYKTNNIFKPEINFNEKQLRLDITSKNLDNNQEVKFYTDINEIKLKLAFNSLLLLADGISIQATSLESPLMALLDISRLDLGYIIAPNKENKKLVDLIINYDIYGIRTFDQKSGEETYTIPHSALKLIVSNIDIQSLLIKHNKNLTNKQFAENAVKAMVEKQTKLKIHDFKFTDSNSQIMLVAETFIDPEYFLAVNADANIKFFKENSLLEKYLKMYKIGQNEKGNYIINARTDKNIISINKGIRIPSPYFKPENSK